MQGHAGRMATRQGKLHKPTRDVGGAEAPAIDASPGCAKEAPQRGRTVAVVDKTELRAPNANSRASDRAVSLHCMARLNHGTGKIGTKGVTPGKGATIAILTLRAAFDGRAGK